MAAFKALVETTEWGNVGYHVPNHTYLESNGKIFAYIQNGRSLPPIYFTKPMVFSKKDRTFVTLKGMPFDLTRINR